MTVWTLEIYHVLLQAKTVRESLPYGERLTCSL